MFLWDSIAFGPIYSRRLGSSLGINVSPTEEKICSFNCVYCECGWTLNTQIKPEYFLPATVILEAIEAKLQDCAINETPIDSITFSGNGEPTLHPEFGEIIDKLIVLRDKYYPQSVITCLSNSTQLYRKDVREALLKIENPILKLDAGSEHAFQLIDRPTIPVSLLEIIDWLLLFHGKLIIQTLLLKGIVDGEAFDNSSGEELRLLIEHIAKIKPRSVMLYSLDRETPAKELTKIPKEELEKIADSIREKGIIVNVY
ncbi:radical SAM protein [Bacteroidales bacterium OttesenSCG-928-B11]|nr:radical SAM protein [Bacteroidales bacterium OttesenSCG-928-E04]MDL2312846.1 radical SAM protein [Bacteroidales bacterium OttesenSCG-928-B11]